MFTFGACNLDRQDATVIPAPPTTQQKKVLSFRFSDEERANLDRACELLARHWQRPKVERSDAMRTALAVLLSELERATAGAATPAASSPPDRPAEPAAARTAGETSLAAKANARHARPASRSR